MKRNGERGVRNSESIINRVMDESGSEVWVHAHTEDGYKSGIELASQDGDRFKQNRVFDISKMTRSRLDAIDDVIMVDLNDETGSEVNYGFYPVEHYRVKRQNSVTESKRNNASEKSYYRPVDTILKVFRKSSSSVSREDRVLHKSTSKHQSKKSKSNKNMNKTQRSDCASRIGMNEMTVYSNKTSHLSRPDLERLYLQSKQALMNLSIQTEEGYKMILDKRLKSAKKLVADTEKMKVGCTDFRRNCLEPIRR